MQPYFVFDLRNNHFAAGIVDNSAGKLCWISEKVLIELSPDHLPDSVAEADLCFFRPIREKKTQWKPISASALNQLRDKQDEYEIISNLFEEPEESLRDNLKPALGTLLSQLRLFINEHKELEILFLVDNPQAVELLTGIAQIFQRPYQIITTPGDIDTLSGFALLDTEQKHPPRKGTIFTCTVEEKLYSYRWNDNCFEAVSSTGLRSGSGWERFSDLERVGLIAFELIWSENHISESKAQLEKLKGENEKLTSLLEKIEQICAELQKFAGSKLFEQA